MENLILQKRGTLIKTPLLKGKVYKPSAPTQATVLSNYNLTPTGSDEWRHIVLEMLVDDFACLEGQTIGIIPPGLDENGKPYKIRLYSIASARDGENNRSGTVAISVKLHKYPDTDTRQLRSGIASHYICNLRVGDRVTVTGPAGKAFVLPEEKDIDLLLFGVGTGIAPFLAFLKQICSTDRPYPGSCFLFYGVKKRNDLAYFNEENNDLEKFAEHKNIKLVTALSRENSDGSKTYVQHRLLDYKLDIWPIIERGNFSIYICGLRGMEKGIDDAFRTIVEESGQNWDELKSEYKKEGRWNQEVY